MGKAIQLADGRLVSIAAYVAGIKHAKANPKVTFRSGFDCWAATGAEVAQEARRHLTETVINRKGGIFHESRRDPITRLAKRIKAGLVIRACKWCGSHFKPTGINDHFDDASCRRSYHC